MTSRGIQFRVSVHSDRLKHLTIFQNSQLIGQIHTKLDLFSSSPILFALCTSLNKNQQQDTQNIELILDRATGEEKFFLGRLHSATTISLKGNNFLRIDKECHIPNISNSNRPGCRRMPPVHHQIFAQNTIQSNNLSTTEMGAAQISNSFVMDDALTPLYNPDFNSFDRDFQHQENINMTSSNHTSNMHQTQTTRDSSRFNTLMEEAPQSSYSELDVELSQFLEDFPLDMGELNEQLHHNYTSGLIFNQTVEDVMTLNRGPKFEEITYPMQHQEKDTDTPSTRLIDETIVFDENHLIHELNTNCQADSAAKPYKLQLSLSDFNPPASEEVNTPLIIRMLLEEPEKVVNNKGDVLASTALVNPLQSFDAVLIPVEETEIPTPSLLFTPNEELDSSAGSSEITQTTETLTVRSKGGRKRQSSTGESYDDLRRIRNNEASRRSRMNRRQRLKGQASMVYELEKEQQNLTAKVKELEQLKKEILKYLKR